MGVPKTARLVAAETVGSRARRLVFEMTSPVAMSFVGGQFIVIDTGMALSSGRLAKRAYSLCSADADVTRFELVARRIDDGVCSGYLHEIEMGTILSFTGPWGKFIPEKVPSPGVTWIVATDTGITTALGLIQGQGFRGYLPQTTLLYLAPSEGDFVPETFVRKRLEHAIAAGARCDLKMGALPPVHHPERISAGLSHFRALQWSDPPLRVYLTGDGALLHPFAEEITRAGLAATRVSLESFFNVPVRPPSDPDKWANR
jgi:ferredoxin-NADP reductase